MAYTLSDLTLPNPKSLVREFIEQSRENVTLYGTTTKKVLHRKERFILSYTNLELLVVNSILALYDLNTTLSFRADDTNLDIGPTDVLMDFSERLYPPVGKTYVENLKIVLTEVK